MAETQQPYDPGPSPGKVVRKRSTTKHPRQRIESDSRFIIALYAGFVAAVVVAAYFAAPLLTFADARWLALTGGLAAVAVIAEWRVMLGINRRRDSIVFRLSAIASVAILIWLLVDAVNNYSANSERCASIERAMLEARPLRADLPDLFTALRCVPSVASDIELPRRPPTPKG